MRSSFSRMGVVTVAAALGLLGCEHWRGQTLRHNQGEGTKPETTGKTNDIDASIPQGEHSGGRLPGALSSEAREIESHFNVR